MKDAMMQGIEETLAETPKVGVQAANIAIKRALFSFLEMALIKMNCRGTLDTIMAKSFNRLSHSDGFIDAQVNSYTYTQR